MFLLDQTCGACPEQYDVYLDDKQVGYFRLRWGTFRASYPDCGGETVYVAELNHDLQGCFSSEDEREEHLLKACKALASKLDLGERTVSYEIN